MRRNSFRKIRISGWWIFLLLLISVFQSVASPRYRFRVYLHTKGEAGYRVDKPEAFLSAEAIARRERMGIAVEADDCPIAPAILDQLAQTGVKPILTSKWMRTVVVESEDYGVEQTLRQLPMVDSVQFVWQGEATAPLDRVKSGERLAPTKEPKKSPYGYALGQIKLLNGLKLHRAGFRGQGMRVAVIDAGFLNADRMRVFDSLRLLGTYNVVSPGQSVFAEDEHGTKVLSCLAANAPGWMVGTAPEASYWLIKSEDSRSEYPIEEDYYVAALEFADSVGVAVVSSSLGYYTFDDDSLSYTQADLDGHTAFISRAAHRAAEKGLLLFSSAGNEGNSTWEKITFPADTEGILTVGSMTSQKERSRFSSKGLTADGRIKPDLVALGSGSCVVVGSGEISYGSGTSFATPILAGMGICLWQALPQLSPQELIDLLRHSGSQAERRDAELGYGLPNLYKAYKKGKKYAKKKH